ncbi:hypothetical protein HO133_011080 [Letharia lupina]|uniref:Uncharacterized protein n=1 Tax=Letharia lupina TaxID=560253 RepID=A0A8H6CJ48_9LECA|nr:uncharacterized protein HO133_011080 [Letharia lupina]KAF6224503.1 hypothetical protein HO133_011080 [Letharia lupina]
MFVDIGGGMVHEGLALKTRYPNPPGRFVNQDLPQIVSDQKLHGIESMAHDFFTPQQLKDPSHSKVLINQWLVPTQRASFMTHQDPNTMATFSPMERTEEETRHLPDGAGLRVLRVWRPDDGKSECVAEAGAR